MDETTHPSAALHYITLLSTHIAIHCVLPQAQVEVMDTDQDPDPEQSFIMQTIIKEKRTRYYSVDEADADDVERGNGHAANHGDDDQAQDADRKPSDEAAQLMDDGAGDRRTSVRSRNPSSKLSRSRNVSIRSVTVVEEKKPMDRPVCNNYGFLKKDVNRIASDGVFKIFSIRY
jgi:hypothetical protein